MLRPTLFITDDKEQTTREVKTIDGFTDVLAEHPLSSQDMRLILNGLKAARCCAVIATAAEAADLPPVALENLVDEGASCSNRDPRR